MTKQIEDVRQTLCDALEKVISGEVNDQQARSIIGLANQISHSFAVEVKVVAMKLRLGQTVEGIGKLKVGR